MQHLRFPSLKSLDRYKSLAGSVTGSAKTSSFSGRPSSDMISSGSFANLKLTAEKLVKEQATVKTDLEIACSKLKKSTEHINLLEEKLQNAFNENAKLKVKQKEDEKVWKGLESKFSSTKTLCDQLTETLQQLARQVQDAEKDKGFFEGKLSESSVAVDSLSLQMNNLSLKLGSAEETIRTRDRELQEVKTEKEEIDKKYIDEQCRTADLMREKDSLTRKFEETVAANTLGAESLKSRLGEAQIELRSQEDEIRHLMSTQDNLVKEKSDLQSSNDDITRRLHVLLQEKINLESFIGLLGEQLVELEKQRVTFAEKFDQLNTLYESCLQLVHQEREIFAKHVQAQHDQLYKKFLCVTLEKDSLKVINQELNDNIIELHKAKKSVLEQLSEERCLAEERIHGLESQAKTLASEKIETETLVSKLEGTIVALSESSRSSEIKMQDLLLKISELEMENNDNTERLQSEMQKKVEEIDGLQKEIEKHKHYVDSLEKQVGQLDSILKEREHLISQYKDREKKMDDQIAENHVSLTDAESKLAEAKKQYDLMLESKQLELSRHLKDISQRNDQAINDIRKKYDMEKLEIVNMEKEKANKDVEEMERKCEQKLEDCKEESRQQLMHVQEEHAALVIRIQQEFDKKELKLRADHSEELKSVQLQAERELRYKSMSLRNEHEVQLKALRSQHEDECQRLQEELDLQKSKEDRQRALLQLQWRVMGNKLQEDQEVNSKKDHSVSSIKMRGSGGCKKSQHAVDSPFLEVTQTPVSQLLKKVENAKSGSVIGIPKHHKKVTHREYEVETSNGRTITKRRKTKSTVMFDDPRKHKKINTPKTRTPRSVVKRVKGGGHPNPSNIGDLFSEGSLNPYADDPYAFD
ncbi:Myosin heavy chain-related protein [Tripterygium wilfordii]|uniref:Myosin heavy chain-related protein n=1 Tax=Tripterygium wilfordii TaxID=458696 RepID=A0A7J7D1W3_TRIWF|nr:synaptonemal complex protein 2-like [Tripterygium wilfordii]KAF5740229.1 Myosin heavy chain-related protein [Tripterygium wilfordii]